MKFTRNLLIFFGLVLVAAFVDAFNATLERHYWQQKPLHELDITDREPQSVEGMLIDTHCPHKRGALGEFLDCRAEMKKKMKRDDI